MQLLPTRSTIAHLLTTAVLGLSIVFVAQQYQAARDRVEATSHIGSMRPAPGPAETLAHTIAPLLPAPVEVAPEPEPLVASGVRRPFTASRVPLPKPAPLPAHVVAKKHHPAAHGAHDYVRSAR